MFGINPEISKRTTNLARKEKISKITKSIYIYIKHEVFLDEHVNNRFLIIQW